VDFKLAFQRLTGRHVLGPGVFWSTFAFGVVAHALGSSDIGNGNAVARLMAVAVAHLALMATIYATRLISLRLKPALIGLVIVAVGYVLAGAVRGLTLQILLYGFGVAESGYSNYRLFGGIVVMTTGLVWAAFAFGIKAEWGSKRAALSARKQQLESLLSASENRLEVEAADTMSTIESMLQTALLPELAESPQRALTKLQSLINDTLRPLSAQLASNQPKLELDRLDPSAYQFRWRTFLTHLRLRESSRPFILGLTLATLAVNGFVQYIPSVSVIWLLVLSFGVIAGALSISRFVLARWVDLLTPGIRVIVVLGVLFICGFGSGIIVLSLAENQFVTFTLSVNGGIASALLGALFGINDAATKEIEVIEQQLKNYEHRLRWTIAALNGQHWMQKKQFARKIHGPIQSEVAAAAIRIERSLSTGEVTESGEVALQNLRDRLAKILDDTKGTSDVRPVLAEIAETWHGLCEVNVDMAADVEAALKLDSICVETVLEIAREACSNAIRHGSAETIHLAVQMAEPDLVLLTVQNDGTKVDAQAKRGVGSAYLDDCTYSHDLEMTATGATLTATIPYRAN
jgi:signal transduction histidine kinase